MKIQYFVLVASCLFISCGGRLSQKKAASPGAAVTATAQHVDPSAAGDDACVFDTSTYRFTTTALSKLDPAMAYSWRTEDATAVVPMKNNDTLLLHIGGCDHFTFQAEYRTDSSKFDDEEYFIDKAKWMAKSFFSQGFDTKYVECISGKRYRRDGAEPAGIKWYNIQDPDTAVTDHVYEGFGVRKIEGRASISISGYVN